VGELNFLAAPLRGNCDVSPHASSEVTSHLADVIVVSCLSGGESNSTVPEP
jgi:hypothetical protein